MAGNTVAVTDADFKQQVLDSDKVVMVDFWAPWCGPCRAVAPILEQIADEYKDKVVVAKVNTDENNNYAGQLGITGIPTMVVFKNGLEVDRIVGAGPKSYYTQRIDKIVS